jgi:lysine 6-dehydrogenase
LFLKIAVIGGYGGMAQVTVRDLIESSNIEKVAICGRSMKKAQAFADELRDGRAIPVEVDLTDKDALREIIRNYDVVINASWFEYNLKVMKTAISAGISYVDLGGLYHMTLEQLKLNEEAEKAGVTCVLGMGSTPGTMNVMAAYAAKKLDIIETVRLRSGYSIVSGKTENVQMPYSFRTVLDEFTKPAPILREGRIVMVPPLSIKEKFTLPSPVGEVEGYLTIHSELATLPKNLNKGVKDMDFAVAYEHEFTNILSVIAKLGLAEKKEIAIGDKHISPFDVISTLLDSVPKETVLDVDIQRVEIEGKKENERVLIQCDAISFPHKRWTIGGGTVDTGVPPSIVAQWLATGKIDVKGVMPPELCIDPLPYFKELNLLDRGIKVYENYESSKTVF